ncbi:DUF397 domain-containing protein [Streptomyces sp. NPDC045369]
MTCRPRIPPRRLRRPGQRLRARTRQPHGPILTFPTTAWTAFIAALKSA